jgi:hypothetical protein
VGGGVGGGGEGGAAAGREGGGGGGDAGGGGGVALRATGLRSAGARRAAGAGRGFFVVRAISSARIFS